MKKNGGWFLVVIGGIVLPIFSSNEPVTFAQAQEAAFDLCYWGFITTPICVLQDFEDLVLTRDLIEHADEIKFPDVYLRGELPQLMAAYEHVMSRVLRSDLREICKRVVEREMHDANRARLHLELEFFFDPEKKERQELSRFQIFIQMVEGLHECVNWVSKDIIDNQESVTLEQNSQLLQQELCYVRFAKKRCASHLVAFFDNALTRGCLDQDLSLLLACVPFDVIKDKYHDWQKEWFYIQQTFNQDPKVMQYKLCQNIIYQLKKVIKKNWNVSFPKLSELANNVVVTGLLPPI